MVHCPPFVEGGARTHLYVEHGVRFRPPNPVVSNRTYSTDALLHLPPSPAASAQNPEPFHRWQDRSRSLPRRHIDKSPGVFFGPCDPRPVPEDPEVKAPRVRARGRSPRCLCDPHSERPLIDRRSALVARQMVTAGCSAAHWTCREPELSVEPRIARRGHCGGRGVVPRVASISASHVPRRATVGRRWRRHKRLHHELPARVGRSTSWRCQ